MFENILSIVLNSDVVWVIGAIVLAYVYQTAKNKWLDNNTAWVKYQAYIVDAIKAAEKLIPDNSGNTAIKRFNLALQMVVTAIERVENKRVPTALSDAIKEGISEVHRELVATGRLPLGSASSSLSEPELSSVMPESISVE